MSKPDESKDQRLKQAEKITSHPEQYKVCEGCGSIVVARAVDSMPITRLMGEPYGQPAARWSPGRWSTRRAAVAHLRSASTRARRASEAA